VLGIGILDSFGWAGAIPNDMYVTIEVVEDVASGGKVKDSAATIMPGISTEHDSALRWRQTIALHNARSTDIVKISLRAGLQGNVMASAVLPVVNFLSSEDSEDGDLLEGVRCAFSDRNLQSRMPLDPTHVRLKRTCM
jgi:hypothetical protein